MYAFAAALPFTSRFNFFPTELALRFLEELARFLGFLLVAAFERRFRRDEVAPRTVPRPFLMIEIAAGVC